MTDEEIGILAVDRALELLGPNGEYWVKGEWESTDETGHACFCAGGALIEACHRVMKELPPLGRKPALTFPFGNVIRFNDSERVIFADVQKFFHRLREVLAAGYKWSEIQWNFSR